MAHPVIVGLFLAVVAPLGVIVWWEFKRARGAPRSVAKAFKHHLDSQVRASPTRVVKETRRGFDA